MEPTRAVTLLQERLAELAHLEEPDDEFEAWRRKTEQTLRKALSDDHKLVKDFEGIRWYLAPLPGITGRNEAIGVLEGAVYELEELSEPPEPSRSLGPVNSPFVGSFNSELWGHVKHLVEQEKWGQVASQTAIFVEDTIRNWAKLPATTYGKELMVAVLKPDSGVFPLGETPGEQAGWLALGIGFVTGVSNATRHRIDRRADDKRYAMGVLGLGSLLLTQVRYQYPDQTITYVRSPRSRQW